LTNDDKIKNIVKQHFCVEVLGNKTRLQEDLLADSLGIMELVMELEDVFDISIPENDIRDGKFTTVGELIIYINERTQEKKIGIGKK